MLAREAVSEPARAVQPVIELHDEVGQGGEGLAGLDRDDTASSGGLNAAERHLPHSRVAALVAAARTDV